MWIERVRSVLLKERLNHFAAVVLLGPRQVGKTTLARLLGQTLNAAYLDLESPSDQARLSDPELYLQRQRGRLVILDEVQRIPELFGLLRGLIDANRLAGHRSGPFLLLGPASVEASGWMARPSATTSICWSISCWCGSSGRCSPTLANAW